MEKEEEILKERERREREKVRETNRPRQRKIYGWIGENRSAHFYSIKF